jgi:hypothetical protein
MNWSLLAGGAQLAFIALFLVTRVRRRRGRRPRELVVYVGPMLFLAVATLAGATWAVVSAVVLYALWSVNALLAAMHIGTDVRVRRSAG